MHLIGKIDKKIYKCITEDIITEEVIITDERILHIKERHPNDFEMVMTYIQEAMRTPDFILRDDHQNTGIVIKTISQNTEHIQMVLRIRASSDEKGYSNSVISCWKISEKRLQNYLRNKTILYKKE